MPRKTVSKPFKEAVSEQEGSGWTIPPDGYVKGAPFWNKRLPWLAETPLCEGFHDVFRDSKTEYGYCKVCGFSFGLV